VEDLRVKVANPHLLLGDIVLANFVVGIVPPQNGYEGVERCMEDSGANIPCRIMSPNGP